ncbi:hypothetical protein EC973_005889 [Apophysomyces ossiformis]|uniref:Ribosome biogenesis protein SLX9 n=1 Tax=Apophysomyces ossiformis TaxID=679940 RepID=A0A8H7BJZ3_9FUNG|nr:hypothetical protein EC973_005889 [Apophysomyces ossiformis]
MPKLQRTKTKGRSQQNDLVHRKYAVRQKDVSEQVVQHNDTNGMDITPIQGKDITISKQMKKKLRHEAWIGKLDTAYTVRKKQQKKKNNKQNELAADLDEFNDLLNTIEIKTPSNTASSAQESTEAPRPVVVPSNKIKSKKAKKKAEMQEILRFQKVMQHSAFKQDPLSTIRQHVQNTFGQS